jgi:hypothetical protein
MTRGKVIHIDYSSSSKKFKCYSPTLYILGFPDKIINIDEANASFSYLMTIVNF